VLEKNVQPRELNTPVVEDSFEDAKIKLVLFRVLFDFLVEIPEGFDLINASYADANIMIREFMRRHGLG
jgi:hypothetical protein